MNRSGRIAAGLLVLAAVFAHGAALAQKNSTVQQSQAVNNDGLYLGGSWGEFDLKLNSVSDLTDGFSDVIDSKHNIWRAFAGYRFNPYAAFEASYVKFGNDPDKSPDAGKSSSGYIPALVLTIPDGGWELFGKLGAYTYGSEFDFMYGMGFGYTFSGRFNFSFDYEVIDLAGRNTDALWLNASMRF